MTTPPPSRSSSPPPYDWIELQDLGNTNNNSSRATPPPPEVGGELPPYFSASNFVVIERGAPSLPSPQQLLSLPEYSRQPPPGYFDETASITSRTSEEMFGTLVSTLCCPANSERDWEDHEVNCIYIASTSDTQLEAVQGGMHITELRGEPVRVLYETGHLYAFARENTCHSRLEVSHTVRAMTYFWDRFFSRHWNVGRRFLVFYQGNGGAYVQAALDSSMHTQDIYVLGLSPTVYIRGNYHVQHYRVRGFWPSCLDSLAACAENTSVLPYGESSDGIFYPSLFSHTFDNAIRYGERCLLVCSEGMGMLPETQQQTSPLTSLEGGHEVALVLNPQQNPEALSIASRLMHEERGGRLESNYMPGRSSNPFMTSMYVLVRLNTLAQIYLMSPYYSFQSNDIVCLIFISSAAVETVSYIFLTVTDSTCGRRYLRVPRLVCTGLRNLALPTTLLELLILSYPRSVEGVPFNVRFILGYMCTTRVVFFAWNLILHWPFRCLRHGIQLFVHRSIIGHTLGARITDLTLASMRYAIVFPSIVSSCLLTALAHANTNILALDPYRLIESGDLRRPAFNDDEMQQADNPWDAYSIGLVINTCIYMLILFANLIFMVYSVRRYHRSRR
ncbi:DUF687 family protein [Chlamydia pneumoniae]|uniref:Uncharacterized protein n=5 Tax=Chlamydia pneumoniae TaxID=83558 RepID=A0A0F7WNJ4_CHLPN|nr:DUF687 family protein [Chlamydia pneumoniae]AAD18222.1 hypothetical protein CPn_0069 [Chlamydia pneumoniae CWL029]CRI36553.1 Uncharacterized protein BN1224_CV14_A_00720 [Chlamydia pneumoniae]CRI39944.1 Uncharacterized protein CWL029c_B_00050 [Chlamydia pneumoniae]CRI47833.1 Uncharacterized protein BN1224_PB2_A_00740 [Chlamydia pneumoniae]CRI52707.1 Uncharacterized protein BN1224_Wien3_A_00730 [Chlamydia pneumoniae]